MKLERKTLLTIFAAALVVFSIVAIYAMLGKIHVTLDESTIQQRIDEKLPYTINLEKRIIFTKKMVDVEASVTQVNVTLNEGNANLAIYATAKGFGKELTCKCNALGKLRYQAGKFYFDPYDIKTETKNKGEIIPDLDPILSKAAVMFLSNVYIYKIPRSAKGIVILSMLNNVKVCDGYIKASISLVKLTITVLLFGLAAIAALSLATVLIFEPEKFKFFLSV